MRRTKLLGLIFLLTGGLWLMAALNHYFNTKEALYLPIVMAILCFIISIMFLRFKNIKFQRKLKGSVKR
ncbi:MAG: hypothetical protein Q4B60_08725 [Erysipelotrichaceae bacterium]|nr:hypothetical protein [Erysipelotrichaceae bacterium]